MNLETNYHNWTENENLWNSLLYGKNVEGILHGKDSKTIVFNAHYDAVEVSPGADDDGSGMSAVLAAAYALSHFEFKHTITFVAFSGEEQGLLGSKAYAKYSYEKNKDIMVELNADMIGYTNTKEGGKKFRMYGTEDISWMMDIIENISREYVPFNFIRGTISGEGHGGSDYFSFVQYGYESIAFFEGEWNPNMHTPDDSIENVNISYLVNTTKLIVATIAYLADMDYAYPEVKIICPKRGRLYMKGEVWQNLSYEKTVVIDDIWVKVDEKDGNSPVVKAEFYYDNRLVYTDKQSPFEWHLNKISFRDHKIKVIVYDASGKRDSDWMHILFINFWK